MGTAELAYFLLVGVVGIVFLFAVARWGQRNQARSARSSSVTWFLFAVARWGQRNTMRKRFRRACLVSIRCREMGTAEPGRGARPPSGRGVSIRCREMGTAEHDIKDSLYDDLKVSIRCREMGTAELFFQTLPSSFRAFLFAVARWGQRNPTPADELLTSANAVRFHTRPKFGRTSVT